VVAVDVDVDVDVDVYVDVYVDVDVDVDDCSGYLTVSIVGVSFKL